MRKIKHWKVSVFEKTSETIRDDTFYTTDTEAYLVFELIDEDFTPDSATVTVYNIYGKATINASAEIADGIASYEMPEDAIGHPGGWRTQVIFTKDNEDYTTKIIEFDVGGHLLDNKKPAIVEIENWNSFIKHAGELVDDWERLEEIRQANEQQRELAESARQNEFEANETSRQTNELVREEAENNRQSTFETNETERQNEFETNETERESTFETNESTRQANELIREEAEGNRQSTFEENEVGRQSEFEENEQGRESAETVRVANEEERISKDSERDNRIETVEERIEENEEDLEQHKLEYVANASRLVAKYVHNSSKEITPQSVDLTTGHFNSTNHGYSDNTPCYITFKNDEIDILYKYLPQELCSNGRFFVRVIDTNTFGLAASNGGNILTLTPKATIDFTKIKFISGNFNVDITNLPEMKVAKVVIKGKGRIRYVLPVGISYNNQWDGQGAYGDLYPINVGTIYGYSECIIDFNGLFTLYRPFRNEINGKSDTTNDVLFDSLPYNNFFVHKNLKDTSFTALNLPNGIVANGLVVEVYKLD